MFIWFVSAPSVAKTKTTILHGLWNLLFFLELVFQTSKSARLKDTAPTIKCCLFSWSVVLPLNAAEFEN
jgi:hypothetical protein